MKQLKKGKKLNSKVNKYKNSGIFLNLGKKVRLTKLVDTTFNGKHPNGINEGYVKEGQELVPPTIGERYYVGLTFSTSPVLKINKNGTIETTYSIYKLEYVDE